VYKKLDDVILNEDGEAIRRPIRLFKLYRSVSFPRDIKPALYNTILEALRGAFSYLGQCK